MSWSQWNTRRESRSGEWWKEKHSSGFNEEGERMRIRWMDQWVTQVKLISFTRVKKGLKEKKITNRKQEGWQVWLVRMDEEKRSDGGDKWYTERARERGRGRENSSKIPSRDAIVPPCQGQERSRTLVKEEEWEKESATQGDNKGYNEDRKEGTMCDSVNAFKGEIRVTRVNYYCLSWCFFGPHQRVKFTQNKYTHRVNLCLRSPDRKSNISHSI